MGNLILLVFHNNHLIKNINLMIKNKYTKDTEKTIKRRIFLRNNRVKNN
jgi:hypothetical protein